MEHDTADNTARDAESASESDFAQSPRVKYIDKNATEGSSRAVHVNVRDHDLPHQQAKWARLSKFYNDRYLDFFIEDSQTSPVDTSLPTTQYGSVTWTGPEKEALFSAIATEGRHNLPDLAAAIRTKSVVEVRDYLNRLKTADAEHQMFAPHAKNVSLAEMDAAVEINKVLEEKLERAADALGAFQDKYDLTKVSAGGKLWLIDMGTAGVLDEENETRETSQLEQSGKLSEADTERDRLLEFFRFGNMLNLSKALFMNTASNSEHEHWKAHAEEDEEPSVTVDAARELYGLVKSLIQRVLQTAIFLAQSRIRSTTRPDYTPTGALKDLDVVAALNILNLPVDSWDYWTKFARRSGVVVILGDHKKGQNNVLTLEQVESSLSIRSSRGRRRSLSSIVSQSSQENLSGSEDEIGTDNIGNGLHPSIEQGQSRDTSSREYEDSETASATSDGEKDVDAEDDVNLSNHNTADENGLYISRKRRRIMAEESQDEYLEKLDRMAQLKEEHILETLFGSETIKEEPEEDNLRKPRGQRKTKEDLKDWSEVVYHSPWEVERSLEKVSGAYPTDDTRQEDT